MCEELFFRKKRNVLTRLLCNEYYLQAVGFHFTAYFIDFIGSGLLILVRHDVLFYFYFVGIDKLEYLQSHENLEIYHKTFGIIDRYFSGDDGSTHLVPNVVGEGDNSQFVFNTDQNLPMGGFNL